jgi:hypothetical protein
MNETSHAKTKIKKMQRKSSACIVAVHDLLYVIQIKNKKGIFRKK